MHDASIFDQESQDLFMSSEFLIVVIFKLLRSRLSFLIKGSDIFITCLFKGCGGFFNMSIIIGKKNPGLLTSWFSFLSHFHWWIHRCENIIENYIKLKVEQKSELGEKTKLFPFGMTCHDFIRCWETIWWKIIHSRVAGIIRINRI